MRYSRYPLTTYKEVPADAQVMSHKLMLRAGLIVKSGAGLYHYSPLYLRVIQKVSTIIKNELDEMGCHEMVMSMITPTDLWNESGRLATMGSLLTAFNDRSNRQLCLSPTNEEAVVDYFRTTTKSYKQLPLTLYQINTKFRDEIRPRFGVMRAREFTMKDAYSFHINQECLTKTYEEIYQAYKKILHACGLKYIVVEADGGEMADDQAKTHEFQILAQSGEDEVVFCEQDGYAANIETAQTVREGLDFDTNQQDLVKIKTLNLKTIEDVCNYLKVPLHQSLKAVAYKYSVENKEKTVVVFVLGDDKVNDVKLKKQLNTTQLEWMATEDLTKEGLVNGFIGPVQLPQSVDVIFDQSIDINACYVVGANEVDYHYKGFCPKKETTYTTCDIRLSDPSDTTKNGHPIQILRGIEVGHIFQLGSKYTALMKGLVLDENGKSVAPLMGCYGIGVGRLIAATIEQHHDEKGIKWPKALSPFDVVLISTSHKETAVVDASEKIYELLNQSDVDVLYDDRKISPGVKFKDADLIGITVQVIVGKKWVQNREVEVVERATGKTAAATLETVIEQVTQLMK